MMQAVAPGAGGDGLAAEDRGCGVEEERPTGQDRRDPGAHDHDALPPWDPRTFTHHRDTPPQPDDPEPAESQDVEAARQPGDGIGFTAPVGDGPSGARPPLSTLPVPWLDEPRTRRRPSLAVLALLMAGVLVVGLGGWLAVTRLARVRPTTSPTPPLAALPPAQAADTFERTMTNGWGQADLGGRWQILAETAAERAHYGVSNGRARFTLDRRVRGTAYLAEPAVVDNDVVVSFASDILPTAGALYVSVLPRATSTEQGYAADLYLGRDHRLRLSLLRQLDPFDVVRLEGATRTLPGTVRRDDVITVRAQATGTNPTQLRAKVWWGTQTEPVEWTVTASDDAVVLQQEAGLAISSYLSQEAATAPAVVSVLDVVARPATP